MRSTHLRLLVFILWACLAVDAACALSFSVCSVPSPCTSVGKIERTQRASFPQTWSYDTENNILSHTDRNTKVETYTYDKENRKTTITRDGLNRGRMAFDGEGRITEQTDPENRTTRFTLDPAGRITHTRLANGILRTATYTPSGDVATTDNGEGQITQYEYDARRRKISETNPTSETTRFVYDNANNLRRSIGAKFTGEPGVLGVGCTAPTGANTYLTTFCYDNANRLVNVIDPNGDQTQYSYDRNDNLIAVLEPGNKKSEFQYDARNRRIQKKSADLATGPPQIWTWTHDGTGDVLTQTDPSGALSTHSYDVLNRRIGTTIENAPAGSPNQQAYQYDPNGNITQRSELNGSQSYALNFLYDAFNRPYQITDANGRIWRQTFDAADERTTLDSDSIPRVSWNYDSNGRPVQITVDGAGVFDLAYDKADRNTTITNPNGVVTTHQFDAAGRITLIEHTRNGGTIARFQYRYDANGNRIEQVEQNGGATSTTTFAYDQADRLVSITEPGKYTQYTLDTNGNRTETKEGPTAGQVTKRLVSTFDARNQIVNQKEYNGTGILVATTTFDFDANGNLTGRTNGAAQTQWRYDALDRLIETTPPTGPPTQYRYGPGDVRIATIRAGMETRHHYDGERLILETNVLGNPQRHYAYSAAGLLSTMILSGTPQYRYAHLDAQTSPIAITAANGNTLNRSRFDAYGVENSLYGVRDQAISFQGYWSGIELEETGNLLSAARIYIPGLGIYGERDPVEGNAREPILFNPYLLGRSNPHRWLDPEGRSSVTTDINNAAQDCGPVSCFGYAFLQVFYQASTLGLASVHDPARDAYDQGEIDGVEFGLAAVSSVALPAATVATGGAAAGYVSGATALSGQVARTAVVGAAYSGGGDVYTQGVLVGGGLQEEYSGAQTLQATALGAAVGTIFPVAARGVSGVRESLSQARVLTARSEAAQRLAASENAPAVRLDSEAGIGQIEPSARGAASRKSYQTPFNPLTSKQKKALQKKVENRTATYEDYQHLQWNRRFDNRRARGVSRFWSMERRSILAGELGTRNWSPEQRQAILDRRTPKHEGASIEGHHRFNALSHPDIADDAMNIYPATDAEHLYRWHGGNYQNETSGFPLNPFFDEEF